LFTHRRKVYLDPASGSSQKWKGVPGPVPFFLDLLISWHYALPMTSRLFVFAPNHLMVYAYSSYGEGEPISG